MEICIKNATTRPETFTFRMVGPLNTMTYSDTSANTKVKCLCSKCRGGGKSPEVGS